MATIDNNLRVPDELRAEAAEIARRQGWTADDLAAEALKRYLVHEKLEELALFGQRRVREMGLDKLSEAEKEAYIERVIRETREERSQ